MVDGKRLPALGRAAQLAEQLLDIALRSGYVYIITNAQPGWVEYSAARWVPELAPLLRQVRIVSARGRFQKQYPGNMRQWKIQAFLEVKSHLEAPITNLIALGDAEFEMDAAQIMGKSCEEGLVKTIKFRPDPTPEAHLKQLEVVARSFEHIVGEARSMHLSLEAKKYVS